MVTIDLNELNLKPHDVVLDAGCGLGRHLRHLARMPELKIFGIDKNTWALTETAKSVATMPDAQSKDYLFSIADITKLPFADSSFDCVICSEVMEHIPDHEKALKEMDRILKPQGTLAVSVPRFFTERICWFISWDYHNEEGGHIRIYKKKQLAEMPGRLEKRRSPAGQILQKISGMGYYEKTAFGADAGRFSKSNNGQKHRLLS